MSFADDDELTEFALGGHLIPTVTEEAVTETLAGFSLPVLPGKGSAWLSTAVRRSLAITIRDRGDGPSRPSNLEIRIEMDRLASSVEATWLDLQKRGAAVESRLWDQAWNSCEGKAGMEIADGVFIGQLPDHRRFNDALIELEWLGRFIREATRTTKSQSGPWRMSEEKRIRIERGQMLAPVYEATFGKAVTANNYPNDPRHKKQTPFMDFYGRMVSLAFGDREKANLAEVVKAACKLHREMPVQFGVGVIPGL